VRKERFLQNHKENLFNRRLARSLPNTVRVSDLFPPGILIVLPGIDPNHPSLSGPGATEGILGLLNTFLGGSFSRASIFALGIMPYISASIIVQLLTFAVPYFQKLQKEGDSGRKRLNQ